MFQPPAADGNVKFGLHLSIGEKIALAGALVLAPFAFMSWQFFESQQHAVNEVARERAGIYFLQAIGAAQQRIENYRNQYAPNDGDMLSQATSFLQSGQAEHDGGLGAAEIVRRAETSIRAVTFVNRAEQSAEASQILMELARLVRGQSGLRYDAAAGELGASDFILEQVPALRAELLALELRLGAPGAASRAGRSETLAAITTLENATQRLDGPPLPGTDGSLAGPRANARQALLALAENLRAPPQGRLALPWLTPNNWRAAYDALNTLDARALAIVDQSLGQRLEQLQAARLRVLLWAAFVLAASLAGAGLALRASVLRPIQRLTVSTASLLDGEYDADIHQQSRTDEIGQIARFLETFREVAKSRTRAEAMRQNAENANLAKSLFIANMSHELRTPLNAIIGYVELVVEDAADRLQTGDVKDLERVLAAARHLLGLINDILDVSKVEAGRMDLFIEEIDVHALLADSAATLAPAAAKNNTRVVVKPNGDIGPFRTDAIKLRQCLLNLISNACKFTRDGEVHLSIEQSETDGKRTLCFHVADTGIGMNATQLGRLFQPFVQADDSITREFGGTGLGLVLTRNMAQLLGGDVAVKSTRGTGSTFTLSITESEQPELESVAAQAAIDAPIVVLIDDEKRAHDFVTATLVPLGFNVKGAAGGEAGMTLLREVHDGPGATLILLDLHLPDRPGWSVLGAIKADPTLSDIPVVVFSVDNDRATSISLGAAEHLLKSVEPNVLAATVLRLARHTPRDASLGTDKDTDEQRIVA